MSKIERQYLPQQISLSLKEKGFNEPCDFYYDYEDGDIRYYPNLSNSDVKYACARPELWQVVEWLAINNIDVEARPTRFAGDDKTSYYSAYINGSVISMTHYQTRKDALLAAIKEALTKI